LHRLFPLGFATTFYSIDEIGSTLSFLGFAVEEPAGTQKNSIFMKKIFYLFCAGALLLAGGCSDDEEWRRRQKIAFADIVDAECLYLTGTDGTRASDEETQPSALFKVTFDGATETVIFTDENGKPIDAEVDFFRRLSDSYLYFLLHIGNSTNLLSWKHLIIRKSDGAVFEMPYYGYDLIIDTETIVQTDYNENVYFFNRYRGTITKIYTHGNEVYETQINRDDMDVYGCLVDRRGNVWIGDYIRLVSGEFARYERDYYSYYGYYFYAWNDSEGFYFSGWDDSEKKWDQKEHLYSMPYKIAYCRPTSPTSTFETIKNVFEAKSDEKYNVGLSFMPLVYKDKTVLFQQYESESKYHKGKRYRIDIYDKDRIELQEMEYHPLPEGIDFDYYGQKYPHTEKYLYGKSESEIWRLDVETGVPEMLYKYNDEFVIKSMTVRNDIVTCTAFELRRGNDVVAEIYPDKTVKVLESTNGDKIIQYERLN